MCQEMLLGVLIDKKMSTKKEFMIELGACFWKQDFILN